MINNHINYVEFKAKDLEKIKAFYSSVFGWTFKDFGEDYTAFHNSGIYGGFEKSKAAARNGALIVLYHENLEYVIDQVKAAGGKITRETFSFPGGRRFHFKDVSGNELAVWSDK